MPKPIAKPNCPDNQLLARYVSGRLDEPRAEAIGAHVEVCAACQSRADSLAGAADSLVRSLRHDVAGPTNEDSAQIDKLIADAKHLETVALKQVETKNGLERRRPTRLNPPPPSIEDFLYCFRQSKLVKTHEIDELFDEIQPSDSRSFARELVARETLTSFQAKALLQGRYRGLTLGKYIILEKLGEGGMAKVFKARHQSMDRTVCIKVLHAAERNSAEHLQRFRREVQTVSALSHPNIVVAHDAAESDGVPYLVMEFIAGNDLAKYVKQRGPMTLDEALPIVRQVAMALQYAHDQGVVHRDIKPHNLLLDEDGNVKVLDLGLARFDSYLNPHPDATNHTSMTSTGVVMGTVDYMSPEQALNSRRADGRSDIYSLGCTLHCLLTGRVLFEGETIMEKLIAHRERAVPSLCDAVGASREADAVFAKMVAKDPDDRYQTMAMFVADVDQLKSGRRPLAMEADNRNSPESSSKIPDGELSALTTIPSTPVGVDASEVEWVAVDTPPRPKKVNRARRFVLQVAFWCCALTAAGGVAAVTAYLIPPKHSPAKRALVVVPYEWFYADHYEEITSALENEGVAYTLASSQSGFAKAKHDEVEPPAVTSLHEFEAADFGTIIFIGGNVQEFKGKATAGYAAKALIESGLKSNCVVGGLGDGYYIVEHSQGCEFRVSKEQGGIEVCVPKSKEYSGCAVRLHSPDQAQAFVVHAQEILQSRHR